MTPVRSHLTTCSHWPWRKTWKQWTPKKPTGSLTKKKKTLDPFVSLSKSEKWFPLILMSLQQGKGTSHLVHSCYRKWLESRPTHLICSTGNRLGKNCLSGCLFLLWCRTDIEAALVEAVVAVEKSYWVFDRHKCKNVNGMKHTVWAWWHLKASMLRS